MTIRDFDEYRECGGCYYISYSFGCNGLLDHFICTHRAYFGRTVELYDFCHISEKYWQ